jgi:CRAL/TRIO domain
MHNGCHVINMSSGLAFLAKLAIRNMEEKNRSNINFYSNFNDFNLIDKDDLPEEFGGKKKLKEIIGESFNLFDFRC